MKDIELVNIWKSYDQKLDEVLSINKEIVFELTKERVSRTIHAMKRPKKAILLIGIPSTLFFYLLTLIGYNAKGIFVMIGFGSISLIMTAIIIGYFYHINLINSISRSQEIFDVQKKISELKISSFNVVRLAIIQIPFWSICWMSLDAFKKSPFIYGGVNLIVFIGLIYLSYWLYKSLNPRNPNAKVRKFFLSGIEWESIKKASEILEQLKEIRK